jgi:acylphosphatase
MIRYSITFTGRVQGVGFRYTTVDIAQRFQVAGWVRNEQDGSVRCVAEGAESQLERFIAALKHRMAGYLADTRIEVSDATGEFQGFDVRR